MPQEIGGSGTNFGLGRGKFEMVLSEATEKGSDVGDVVGGIGVEDDDAVEVRGDAFQASDDFVSGLNEPTGGGIAALRYHKSLEQPVWCADHRQRDGVLADDDPVKQRDQVEERKNAPSSQGIEDLVDAGDGDLPEGADGVQVLVVDCHADTAVFFRDSNHQA